MGYEPGQTAKAKTETGLRTFPALYVIGSYR